MNTSLKTPEEVKAAFSKLFTNRSAGQQREDAAQLLSFRFLSEVERVMKAQGLTKRQLAAAVGTSASYITQLFRGDRLVNVDMLARFEQALGVQFTASSTESAVIAKPRPTGNAKRSRGTKATVGVQP